jgi:AcrR family transcriptional regulator
MVREKSNTFRHILEVTEQLLADSDGQKLRMEDIAKLAHVSEPTIYYHFSSRNQLIATAQVSAYLKLTGPLHQYLDAAEAAIAAKDHDTYVTAVSDNVAMAWTYGKTDDKWRIARLFIDIWSDPKTQKEFCAMLDVQLSRWISVIEASKNLGWTDPEVDTMALVTSCWAGSIGQAIFVNSALLNYTPESIRDFYMKVSGHKTP